MSVIVSFLSLFAPKSPEPVATRPARLDRTQSLDIATGGRRGKGWGTVANINRDILAARGLGSGRARYGAYSQPLVASCRVRFRVEYDRHRNPNCSRDMDPGSRQNPLTTIRGLDGQLRFLRAANSLWNSKHDGGAVFHRW